ncbi:MAG: MarR family transcriptional regulator [Chloroflexi bacterium]|nr:MarR family transcriptional regulator [Chloroflexota bacterium]
MAISSDAPRSRQSRIAALREASVRLSNHNGFYTAAAAARLGLNRTDVDCLSILFLEGPITAGRLAEATGLTTGGVTGILDRLERAGFVRRESDPEDRRRVIVRVSPEQGRRLIDLFAPMQQAMDALYEQYDDDKLAVLLDHTDRSLAVMQEETARLRQERTEAFGATERDGLFFAPLHGTTGASLELAGLAGPVHVRGEAGMAELFRGRLEGGGVKVTVDWGTVRIAGRGRLFGERQPEGEIVLNTAVPWAIRVQGGSNPVTADLVPVNVTEIEMSGGMSNIEFRLGAPAGTVPIRVSGGASRMTFHRPAGTPVRLHVRGGISDVRLDDRRLDSASRVAWETPGYAGAEGRYEITVRGGMSRLSVDET